MTKIPCSVPILTLNRRNALERCLPLLNEYFDDVFLFDGNSTDGTREYAESLGIRIENQFATSEPNQKIENFRDMRLRSWKLCKYDWVFYFDSDETITKKTIEQIRDAVAKDDPHAFYRFTSRIILPDGRIPEHAFCYAIPTPRLFHRGIGVTLADRPVHEKFVFPEAVHYVDVESDMLVPWESAEEMWKRQRRYAELDGEHVLPGWKHFFVKILYFNFRSLFGQLIRSIRAMLIGLVRHEVALPWSYTYYGVIRYRFSVIGHQLRAWFRITFR